MAGENWSTRHSGLFSTNVEALAIDPTNTSTLYAGGAFAYLRAAMAGGVGATTA